MSVRDTRGDAGTVQRLILIRHVATATQHAGVYTGHLDVPCYPPYLLDAKGAETLLRPDMVWCCSDLQRARVTACWLMEQFGLVCPVSFTPALREQHFGAWEGRGYTEIYEANPALDWQHPARLCPPGGENFDAVMQRVGAWMQVMPQCGDVVIVAHAGSLRALIAQALGLSAEQALCLKLDPGSVSSVVFYGTSAVLDFMNRPLLGPIT